MVMISGGMLGTWIHIGDLQRFIPWNNMKGMTQQLWKHGPERTKVLQLEKAPLAVLVLRRVLSYIFQAILRGCCMMSRTTRFWILLGVKEDFFNRFCSVYNISWLYLWHHKIKFIKPTTMFLCVLCLVLLYAQVQTGNVGLSMEEIHLPKTMHKVYESNQKTIIPANVFKSPENGERTDVVIRRSRRKNGDIIVQAFQGNLNTMQNQVESFGHNPFKDAKLMKSSFRNLKGSASFLEGDQDNSDFVDDRERI
eukprot:TRINITY_DN5293_c0_g1_i7.p2 TRINITY_DN5293_c0_g1~~TRINITY_DN5293_c0_g1_i7.p2  ORF type:complete len:252 (-),score=17.38 TRINITY_DN5293_c0_g1_i7:87-842(-)